LKTGLRGFLQNWARPKKVQKTSETRVKTGLHGFLHNCARPKKVQKDKGNQCGTELIRGYLASGIHDSLVITMN
jgi:hypothetical protein